MIIIPAIDIIGGKCVRLSQGDYSRQKVYDEHPLEVAKRFEDAGLTRLHLVDLDGARTGAVVNWKVLEKIAAGTGLIIDFGGGIKTGKDIEIVFNSGAAMAAIGSVAVRDPELFRGWISRYGGEKIFLGADVREEKIAIAGWKEQTELSVFDFIGDNLQHGVQQIFCTDVSKDGLLEGPAVELYKKILEKFPEMHLVASGGVSSMEDLFALEEAGCKGTIVGKAIYEGRITLGQMMKWREENGEDSQ